MGSNVLSRVNYFFTGPEDGIVIEQPPLLDRISEQVNVSLEKVGSFIGEVGGVYERGDLRPEMPSMRALGYRQAWRYLAGELDEQTWVEQGIIATRQYAKRQMTWLRGERDRYELPAESGSVIDKACKYLISCAVLDDLHG